MNITILTDFLNHDPAYSLCGVVMTQLKMLKLGEHKVQVLVRGNPDGFTPYAELGAEIVKLDPGKTGSNVVVVDHDSPAEIDSLAGQLGEALKDQQVVLTHDMIYQPNLWKYHVAARRIAPERPSLKWLHWIHSTTPMNTANKTKQFAKGLEGKMPNSKLVVMTREEAFRKSGEFGYELDETVYIPNAMDLMEGYDPVAKQALETVGAHKAHVLFAFPARLDRGKQVEVIIEVAGKVKEIGHDARVIVIDFHSIAGDKALYRSMLQEKAIKASVPCLFTSELGGTAEYHIPHKAVLDIFHYADVMIHPSRSECDPLILPEAMWNRNLTVLNFDLPMFRTYNDISLLYQFSSNINALNGQAGETNTSYADRDDYMKGIARAILYMAENDRIMKGHIYARKERGLENVMAKYLEPALGA